MLIRGRVVRVFEKDKAGGKANYSVARQKALGQLLVLSSEDNNLIPAGNNLYFTTVPWSQPPFLRRHVLVRASGKLESIGKNQHIFAATSISPDFSRRAIEAFLAQDLNLSAGDWQELFTQAGTVRETEVVEMLQSGKLEHHKASSLFRVAAHTEVATLLSMFTQAGLELDLSAAVMVYDSFKHRADYHRTTVSELVRSDPWILYQVDDPTFTLEICDQLAKSLGVRTSEDTLASQAMAIALNDGRRGHAYTTLAKIWAATRKLRNKLQMDRISNRDLALLLNSKNSGSGRVIVDFQLKDDVYADRQEHLTTVYPADPPDKTARRARQQAQAVYPARSFFSERYAAEKLAKLARSGQDYRRLVQPYLSGPLDQYQAEAIETALCKGVSIWCGAAGSGKTYALKKLTQGLLKARLRCLILAPTAIGAARAAVGTGLSDQEYATIHRMVGVRASEGDWSFFDPSVYDGVSIANEEIAATAEEAEPETRLAADVVIVDEMSMCDLPTLAHLLHCIEPGVNVVLVGDDNQLPALGPSGFYQQLIRMLVPGVPVCRLRGDHRSGDALVRVANTIRHGSFPAQAFMFSKPEDVRSGEPPLVLVPSDPSDILGTVRSITRQFVASGVDRSTFWVLAKKRGLGGASTPGTDALNRVLREEFNPNEKLIAGTNVALNDPVIAIQNDYVSRKRLSSIWRHPGRHIDIYNGMTGVIAGVDKDEEGSITIRILYTNPDESSFEVPYTADELGFWVEPAYAVTVHKAQGGEVDHVVLVGDPTMDRKMLYTGLTRARKQCVLVGAQELWEQAAASLHEDPLTKFAQRYLAARRASGYESENRWGTEKKGDARTIWL